MEHSETVDEKETVLRCKAGDKKAYGFLVSKYMKRAYYVALGFVSDHDNALDLSQEAFVRAYKAIDRFDENKRFYTWYYQILRNLCFNFIRDKKKRARSFTEIGDNQVMHFSDPGQNPETLMVLNERRQAVWDALNEMKVNHREIILLKDFQNLSYQEIADLLECPVGTVMSRLYNARKALKERLESFFR